MTRPALSQRQIKKFCSRSKGGVCKFTRFNINRFYINKKAGNKNHRLFYDNNCCYAFLKVSSNVLPCFNSSMLPFKV